MYKRSVKLALKNLKFKTLFCLVTFQVYTPLNMVCTPRDLNL